MKKVLIVLYIIMTSFLMIGSLKKDLEQHKSTTHVEQKEIGRRKASFAGSIEEIDYLKFFDILDQLGPINGGGYGSPTAGRYGQPTGQTGYIGNPGSGGSLGGIGQSVGKGIGTAIGSGLILISQGDSGETKKEDKKQPSEETLKKIDEILKNASDGKVDKSIQKHKAGDYSNALEDFNKFGFKETKEVNTTYGPETMGILEDGTSVIPRKDSKEGSPTLEIRLPNGKVIKIRYGENKNE